MNPTAKGVATSEGQLTIAALIAAVAAALAPLAAVVQAVAIVVAGAVAVVYIWSRAHLKTATVERIPSTATTAKRRAAGGDG